MIHTGNAAQKFGYEPGEHECEKASNSYLMSLVALIAGLPLPIINLVATFIFYLQNRNGTWFVRWHCTQALLSQVAVLFLNSYAFWWTVSLIRDTETEAGNDYFAYLIVVLLVNLVEFVATIYAAILTRKGVHVDWFIIGDIADSIVRPSHEERY